jgi:putative phosphoesterase
VATRLLLMADTHVPRRARDLPAALWAEVEQADVVVHAGDWLNADIVAEVAKRSRRLIAVHGNNDTPDVVARLPELARETIAGVRLAVVHDSGPRLRREERWAAALPDFDVLVFGHSHIPWDTTATSGLRLLNPGSPTDRRSQPYATFMTATIDGAAPLDVVLHRLPR